MKCGTVVKRRYRKKRPKFWRKGRAARRQSLTWPKWKPSTRPFLRAIVRSSGTRRCGDIDDLKFFIIFFGNFLKRPGQLGLKNVMFWQKFGDDLKNFQKWPSKLSTKNSNSTLRTLIRFSELPRLQSLSVETTPQVVICYFRRSFRGCTKECISTILSKDRNNNDCVRFGWLSSFESLYGYFDRLLWFTQHEKQDSGGAQRLQLLPFLLIVSFYYLRPSCHPKKGPQKPSE